jgi:ribose 5-phosphate isomerase B
MRETMPEEILIASDHAGVEMKGKLEAELKRMGFAVKDFGTNSTESTDYADFAHPLAKDISRGRHKRGVLLCGTGLGMSYVANRYPNVRAAVTWTPEIAALSRSHNDSNVLVLPSRFVNDTDALAILHKWLETPFEGGRHERRVVKIDTATSKATSKTTSKATSKTTLKSKATSRSKSRSSQRSKSRSPSRSKSARTKRK